MVDATTRRTKRQHDPSLRNAMREREARLELFFSKPLRMPFLEKPVMRKEGTDAISDFKEEQLAKFIDGKLYEAAASCQIGYAKGVTEAFISVMSKIKGTVRYKDLYNELHELVSPMLAEAAVAEEVRDRVWTGIKIPEGVEKYLSGKGYTGADLEEAIS